ncbi:Maf family protein [Flavihumibacter petaseus]|uniref:dTTP/UTP pyrophosphatase n=1 Tax=Flavihumibacter petaseus NBRC 106054 TaxID=1220578 RepID=A0A0E9N7K0_9BACT|nr:Maf family protein [Flavihumibacter petaseus]GAO45335.1 Maf-like protein [Flavihumibacter petaseus NBRC 106054]
MTKQITLASQSPRRKQLLEWAEIPFVIRVADTDESFPEHMPVEEVPVHIAREKCQAVMARETGDGIYIAADTVVVLDNRIIGKPTSVEDAVSILQSLSGKEHRVITGVVIRNASKEISFADITHVSFHTLTEDQIRFYVNKYQPFDKAGAYAIQEWIGVVGIRSVTGDFYNVMGLPVSRVVKALEQFR